MIQIRRWLRYRKLRNCSHRQHKMPEPTRRTYFQWPSKYWSGVADEVTVDIAQCRCGRRKVCNEVDRTNLTGLTMSSSQWAELRENGILFR